MGKKIIYFSRNIFISLFSIFIFFGILELICRFLPIEVKKEKNSSAMDLSLWGKGPYARPDPVLAYRLIPNLSIGEYKFNSKGYRGKEFSIEKPDNVFRIICIGGSTTIGSNCGANEFTYPALLEEIFTKTLSLKEKKIEVINAGVFGYNIWHNIIQIEEELDHFKPDMYLIMAGVNDAITAITIPIEYIEDIARYYLHLVKSRKIKIVIIIDKFLSRLKFYRIVKDLIHTINTPNLISQFDFNRDINVLTKKFRLFRYKSNLNKIIKHCKERKVEIAIINYPWLYKNNLSNEENRKKIPYDVNDEEIIIYRFGNSVVPIANSAIARKDKVLYIDLQPIFDSMIEDKGNIYRLYSDNLHFTRYGNYLIACEVYRKIMGLRELKEFTGRKEALGQEEIDKLFYEIISWRPPSGGGWPDDINSGPKVEIVGVEGLVSEKSEYSGWDFYKISGDDEEKVGRIRLLIDRDSLNDRTIIFYPRIAYPSDGIYIDLINKDGARDRIFSISPYANSEWTPVSGRYEVMFPMFQDENMEIEIILDGENTQLWHNNNKLLFYVN